MKRAELWAVSLLPLLGCDDALEPAQRLDEPRVLGARVSSAAGEASLTPGRAGHLDVLVAGPDGPVTAAVAFQLCTAVDAQRGVPSCAEAPFSEGLFESPNGSPDFDVPDTLEPGAALALLGVACSTGAPALSGAPLAWSCSGDAAPLRFSFDASVTLDTANLHPDASDLAVTVAGQDLELADPNQAATCDDPAVVIEPGVSSLVELRLGAGAREEGETLQLSHFSNLGQFERQFSFVEAAQAPLVTLRWTAPREPGAVKQYLVLRDGRGGVSWATWSLCVR